MWMAGETPQRAATHRRSPALEAGGECHCRDARRGTRRGATRLGNTGRRGLGAWEPWVNVDKTIENNRKMVVFKADFMVI